MRFLGTAAADILPCPLCACPICTEARLNPAIGRLRSMFLLDGENLIDCGPDFVAAVMRHGLDVTNLKNVFITHTHADHMDPTNAGLVKFSQTRPDVPVDVYMSQAALDTCMTQYNLLHDLFPTRDSIQCMDRGLIRLHPVKTGEMYSIGGYEVLAVNTTHHATPSETAINYMFQRNGKKLLYACDTGFYTREALDSLNNAKLDFLVMEGTWGSHTDMPTTSHLNATTFLQQLETFAAYNIIREDTAIYCTHINHKHDFNHTRYQEWFDAHTNRNVTVAWDGLDIGPLA